LYWNNSYGEIIEVHPNAATPLHKFHLHLEYRAQLKSYTKLHFDPFRRHERISFILETTPELSVIETTVGQLNFFRWAIQNNVLAYIENHLAAVEKAMAEPVGSAVPSSGTSQKVRPTTVPVAGAIKNKATVPMPAKAVVNQVRAQCHLSFD